jgi:hypothetical protein
MNRQRMKADSGWNLDEKENYDWYNRDIFSRYLDS